MQYLCFVHPQQGQRQNPACPFSKMTAFCFLGYTYLVRLVEEMLKFFLSMRIISQTFSRCAWTTVVAEEAPSVDSMIMDGAALVNMLKPGMSKTLDEFASTVFVPYILRQPEVVKRVDVLWDICIQDSLKGTARGNRGHGI